MFKQERLVKVDREKLLDTLRDNREHHVAQYREACAVFRRQARDVLSARLGGVETRAVDKILQFELRPPVSYVDEYDKAITWVEWSTEDHIELDESTFEQWVLDRWGWQSTFDAVTGSYLS